MDSIQLASLQLQKLRTRFVIYWNLQTIFHGQYHHASLRVSYTYGQGRGINNTDVTSGNRKKWETLHFNYAVSND
jgi:hypothetical protein